MSLIILSPFFIFFILKVCKFLTAFLNLLINHLYIYIYIYIYMKMSKDSSAKYYQKKQIKTTKKACGRYESLSKEKKENN